MNCGLNDHGASLPDVLGGQTLTMKMAVALGAIALTLVGCGTVTTVLQEDADAARGFEGKKPIASPFLGSTAGWPTIFVY
jgi:hypothetical protein